MDTMQDLFISARNLLGLWKRQETLSVEEVPTYLHEPGIIKGYRLTNQTWFYYAKSVFHLHNETFNIWTHLVGFYIMWITLAQYALVYNFWEDQESWPLITFGICCLIAMGASTFAHIFHSMSENMHYTVLYLDYIGVSFYGFGMGLLALYVFSDDQTYATLEPVMFPLLWLYAFFDFLLMCIVKVKYNYQSARKYWIVGAFAIYGFLVTVPVGRRYWICFTDDSCSMGSLNHLTVMYGMFLLMGFTFGSHLPELIFPGLFDIIGQSHQLFHIVSTTSQILQLHIAHAETSKRLHHHGNPDLNFLILSSMALLLCQLMSLLLIRRFFFSKMDAKNK